MIAALGYLLMGLAALAAFVRGFWLEYTAKPLDGQFARRFVRVMQYLLLGTALSIPPLAAVGTGSGAGETPLWAGLAALGVTVALEAALRISQIPAVRSRLTRIVDHSIALNGRAPYAVLLLAAVAALACALNDLWFGFAAMVMLMLIQAPEAYLYVRRRRSGDTASRTSTD